MHSTLKGRTWVVGERLSKRTRLSPMEFGALCTQHSKDAPGWLVSGSVSAHAYHPWSSVLYALNTQRTHPGGW